MGKQKDRLTATKTLFDPARSAQVGPSTEHVVAAANGLVRASAAAKQARPAVAVAQQQVRGVKTIDFAGTPEDVYGK